MAAQESLVLDGLELNDGTVFAVGELSFPPAPRLVEWVRSADSDGSLLAREPPADNREGTVTLWVAQQATKDLALAKLAQITDKLTEAQRNPTGIALVWTPADSTLSVTGMVLYGEIVELPMSWESGWMNSAPTAHIKLTMAPFFEGVEIGDLTDDFSTNTIANYTLDTGGGTVSVSGGVLVPSSTAEKRLIHTSSAYAYTDGWTTVKFLTGASVASGTAGAIAKRLDASNYLAGQIAAAGASTRVNVVKVDATVSTTLVQSGTFTLSTATNYWIRLRVESNVVTVEMFTAAPTFTSTPAQTATATLAGADATKFGSGIAGRNGIRMIPQATDWRADDFTVQPNVARSTEPVVTLEVSNVPGDVPAEVRAIVTDGASQARRTVRVGLESRYYPTSSPPALLIDSASLVTTGYSGTASTVTGAYSANGTVYSGALYSSATALCGLGNLSHVGTFRVFARVYVSCPLADMAWIRLSWQEGSGPMRSNAWVTPPANLNVFAEVDLGVVTIPERVLGTQLWTGQIEAYLSTSPELFSTVDIDYLYLIPLGEGYGQALGPYNYTPGTITASSTLDGTLAAALGGTAAELGGNWTTAGVPATDFAFAADGVSRTTAASEAFPGRYGTLATVKTATDVAVDVKIVIGTYAPPQQMLLARFVNSSNFLFLEYLPSTTSTSAQLSINTRIAGVTAVLASSGAWILTAQWATMRLVVFPSGTVHGYMYLEDGTEYLHLSASSSALFTGGTLDDGTVGIADYNPSVNAYTRLFRNFVVATPPAEPIACNSAQSIEFRTDDILREDSTGTYWGPPPQARAGLRGLPPAGTRLRKSRVAVVARRNDVTVTQDDQIADATAVQMVFTPRYLYAPR